jgi:hypothetical protein
MPSVTDAPAPAVPLYLRVWRYVKGGVALFIVVFHLAVLAVRNPLDLWYNEIRDWLKEHPAGAEQSWWAEVGEKERGPLRLADNFTWKYTNFWGIEQRWVMFTPPVARKAPFLSMRLEFGDGSSELMLSCNEPDDPARFCRVGGWQARKLEEYLLYPTRDLAHDPERPLWEAYARHKLHKWHRARPGDPREITRLVFVRRHLHFTAPGQTHADVDPPTEDDIVYFDANGNFLGILE